jgi:hypothetical protein
MMLRNRTRNQRMTEMRKHKNAGKPQQHRGPAIGPRPAPTPETMEIASFTFAITKERTYFPGIGTLYTATAKLTGENLPLPQAWCVWTGNGDTPEEALSFMKLKIEHEFEAQS